MAFIFISFWDLFFGHLGFEYFVHSYDQDCMKMQVLCLFGKRCVYVLFCLNILEGLVDHLLGYSDWP